MQLSGGSMPKFAKFKIIPKKLIKVLIEKGLLTEEEVKSIIALEEPKT